MKTLAERMKRSHVVVRYEKDELSEPPFSMYRVRLSRRPRYFCGPLYLSVAFLPPEPTPEDILHMLLNQARVGALTYEAYCRSLKLDEDSRKAHAAWTYHARIRNRLHEFFGEKMLAEFSAAEVRDANGRLLEEMRRDDRGS